MKILKNLSLFLFITILSIIFVMAAHTVTLNTPINASYTNDNTPDFNFTVNGSNASYTAELFIGGFSNGTLVVLNNTLSNITNASALEDGTYTWYVNATNSSVTTQSTTSRTLIIDTVAPNVTLNMTNGTTDTDGTVIFYYNVTDANAITNCTLYLNATLNQTNHSITNGSSQNFTVNNMQQSDALYWFISCEDNATNLGNSSTYAIDTYANPVAAVAATPSITATDGITRDDLVEYNVQILEEAAEWDFNEGDTIFVKVNGDTYEIEITEVKSETIDVYFVDSDTTLQVKENVKKKVDADRDGTYDFYIALKEIVDSNTATIELELYVESVSESIEEVEEQAIIIEDLEPVVEENFTSSKWWIWTLVGVMVVLLAVLAIRLKLHKKLIKKK